MLRKFALAFCAALLPGTASAATVDVFDADVATGSNVVWTADNEYILNGLVFVDDGATLTIQPGTVIKGKPGQGENASALVVARGGKIFASGTPDMPIVFTAEADDVSDPGDLPLDARGLWGGVILLGHATLNSQPGETPIEGIPTTEARGIYGGDDDADNSGIFRYVSIRYGGTDIGAGNEINGLTMGGVGSGTLIEFVEVYNNQDDGFEWFGGTVNTKHLVSAFNGDDAFDYDEGFRGKGQFWFVIQDADTGNRAGEHDGGTTPEDGAPYAIPQIHNVTYIGSGAFSANGDNDVVLKIRDNAGGQYINSIFTDFAGEAVSIEDLESGEDSRARLEAGDLRLANNIWWGFGAGDDLATIAPEEFIAEHLAANDNRIVDPLLGGISRDRDQGLDPRPQSGSPAFSGLAATPDDGFYTQVDYIGAFGRNLWTSGWTFLSEAGIMPSDAATFIAEESAVEAALPSGYALEQNTPNPFNPNTTIRYSMAADGHVKLTVYNSVGQEMATLVNGSRPAGIHAVSLNAAAYSTGIYFYRLEAGGQTLMRKMTLLK
ncbi:MAG: hypothetical protein CMP27_00175 [Roseibacillus sp.]|nr:hypothetical protein [Roseibacillus sp.]